MSTETIQEVIEQSEVEATAKALTLNLGDLLDTSTSDDGEVTLLNGVLPLVDVVDTLHLTDIIYKLSYVGGTLLQQLARKVTQVKLMEIEDEEVDDLFTEDEKAYMYGCYLIATIEPGKRMVESGALLEKR